jgi:sugar/nucleoside kinase (ribokinase family)
MEALDLVAVGDVMVDLSIEGSGHSANVRVRPGGSSANVAVWAAAAGARAGVVGRVGDDLSGRLVRSALEERGVRPLLSVDPDRPTGCVVTGPSGIAVDRGATAALAPEDVPAELRAGAVVVSGYAFFLPGSDDAARAAIERSRAEWVALDVGEGLRTVDLRAVDGVGAVVANEAVAQTLTGRPAAEAAAELGASFRLACITRGADGAVAAADGELVTAPAPLVDAVDPVGAGDAFAAALFVALVRGAAVSEALAEACRLGARAAASPDPWPT